MQVLELHVEKDWGQIVSSYQAVESVVDFCREVVGQGGQVPALLPFLGALLQKGGWIDKALLLFGI